MKPLTDPSQHTRETVLRSADKPELCPEISGNGFSPLRLAPLPHAFDDPEFIFELKYDGFRALAYVDDCGGTRMISRHGNVYRAFPRLTAAIAEGLKGRDAVLDGEIAVREPLHHWDTSASTIPAVGCSRGDANNLQSLADVYRVPELR